MLQRFIKFKTDNIIILSINNSLDVDAIGSIGQPFKQIRLIIIIIIVVVVGDILVFPQIAHLLLFESVCSEHVHKINHFDKSIYICFLLFQQHANCVYVIFESIKIGNCLFICRWIVILIYFQFELNSVNRNSFIKSLGYGSEKP